MIFGGKTTGRGVEKSFPSNAPAGAIGGAQMGIGLLIIGEPHRLVVPLERLTRETNGDESEQGHLSQRAAVIKIRTSLASGADCLDPIPGVPLDARDFFRRRILARVLFH